MSVFRDTTKVIVIILILALVLSAEAKETVLIGKASWYSYESCRKEGSNGHYTASGKKFNENDYTAAIWDYPFGTRLKVTNLSNGLSVQIVVWDRGPSRKLVKKGRIIDLSRAAFAKICPLEKGICKVKIEVINGN